ncbi:hypothetical protein [Streptomyces jumonjinensis]|uniref:hypothetical protein n=1 Tax=Streptomyces jumonjinensis TaxID=1945 RepID=UPI00378F6B9D
MEADAVRLRQSRRPAPAVLAALTTVTAALQVPQADDIHVRLHRVRSQLAYAAASMAWHAAVERRAAHYYQLAHDAALDGADAAFAAGALAGAARHRLYAGRPAAALRLVQRAQSTPGLEPRLRALLHTRAAWAYAAMGRGPEYGRESGRATGTLEAAGPVSESPPWLRFFDETELSGTSGGRLLDLARQGSRGQAETAAIFTRAALENRAPGTLSHALDLIGLAECYWLTGDTRSAVPATERAVASALPLPATSPPLQHHMSALRAVAGLESRDVMTRWLLR